MNNFESTEGSGLLKESYPSYYEEEDRLTDALRKRRQKLAEKKLGLQPDEIDQDNG